MSLFPLRFHFWKGAVDDPAQEAHGRGNETEHLRPRADQLYVGNVARFAQHFGKSPEVLGQEQVRQYLLHLVEEKKLARGTYTRRWRPSNTATC